MKNLLIFLFFLTGFLYANQIVSNSVWITNINDCSFSVVWITNHKCQGFVKYWKTIDAFMFSYDERGSDYKGLVHFVTISGLEPQTEYYFLLSDGTHYVDNNGNPFSVKTGPILSIPFPYQIYGRILRDGAPAKDAIVFVRIKDKDGKGSSDCSGAAVGTVNENGYWSVNIGNARTSDLQSYFSWSETGDLLEIVVFSPEGNQSNFSFPCSQSRPVPVITIEK